MKKLKLKKETLRTLSDRSLGVAGGLYFPVTVLCPTKVGCSIGCTLTVCGNCTEKRTDDCPIYSIELCP